MTTLTEKQTVPANANTMPTSLFFILNSSISRINIVGRASTVNHGGERISGNGFSGEAS